MPRHSCPKAGVAAAAPKNVSLVAPAVSGNYQTMINSALRDYVTTRVEPIEDALRRVLREERARYMTVREREPIRAGAASLEVAEGGRLFPLFSGSGIKIRDLLRVLDEDGWYLVMQRGSHRQYKHPSKKGLVTVAGNVSGDLAPGTLNSILKQARLKR
jgi:predicted RNA binding protein YcfA (HicA-like mRNA interferase family)